MAKKVVRVEPSIADWTEADAVLRRIGQIGQRIAAMELRMNQEIDAAKHRCKAEAEPMLEERRRLEKELRQFCEKRRVEFDGRQSRRLTFGTVMFRRSARLVIHNIANTMEAIRQLFSVDEGRLYVTETVNRTLNREALETLPEERLAALGVTRKEQESFGYEIDTEVIA